MLFLLAVMLVFSWYFLTGTSFIWKKDGWTQHYKSLIYYSKYLRQIFYGIFYKHQFAVPQWDFSIGEGNDILATFHYYVMGDPFTVFSVFVPESFMYIYYAGIIILRMYLAGIAFSYFCFKTGRTSHYAVMAGSLSYFFCYWAVINAVTHPYFLNPMIYLPLLLTGIEKILKKESPALFIISVFLSAISNFYFFYMLVILTIIYVATRLCILYTGELKKCLPVLWRIIVSSVSGVLMASVILLPVCYIFLNDTRMSSEATYPFLYPLSYYGQLPVLFTTSNHINWTSMGYAAPVLPAVFLLFYKRRKYFLIKSLFITGIVIILVPFFGKALNGFSYVTNRWSFAFAFVCAYILTLMWHHLLHLKAEEVRILAACTTLYFIICIAVCIISENTSKNVCISVFLAYMFLIVVMPQAMQFKNKIKVSYRIRKQKTAIAIIIFSIFCNSYFSYVYSDYIQKRKKTSEIQELTQNETNAVLKASELDNINSFFRYSGNKLTENANIIAGISSTQYFWSLSNPCITDFRRKLGLCEEMSFKYTGYDDSTALMSLASVLYYTQPSGKKNLPPYGFELMENMPDSDYTVYRNKYALPPGYTYESYISKEKWEKLTAIHKQETLLQNIVIEDYNGKIPKSNVKYLSEEINYKATCKNNNVIINDNSFKVLSDGAKVKLKFKSLENSEIYFYINSLDLQENLTMPEKLVHGNTTKSEIKLESSAGNTKKLIYRTKQNQHYNNRHDFTINLGYSKKPVEWITITFPVAGTYSFNSIGIVCEPMQGYKNKISALKEDTLKNIKTGTNCFSGNISLKQPKFLCIPIPYSVGWEAFVDGKKADLYKANLMYMALELDAGSHNIVLKYHTPFLKAGTCISVLSVLFYGVWMWLLKTRKTERKINI